MNFFGVLGQLGRMLPGYVEGRRQAIQDNWQDMSNYNQIYHGQLQNAYDTATWEPQMEDRWRQSGMLDLAAKQALGNYNIWEQTLPEEIRNALPRYRMQQQQMSQIAQLMQQWMPDMFERWFGQQYGVPAVPPQPQNPTSLDPAQNKQRLEQP